MKVVGGVFRRTGAILEFLKRFEQNRLIGVHVSMPEPIDVWNPFDVLIQRDGSIARPDSPVAAKTPAVPVVAIIHPAAGPDSGVSGAVREAIERLVRSRPMAVVRIDAPRTDGSAGPRDVPEFEALVCRMDLVITSCPHALIRALEHGVPSIAIEVGTEETDLSRQAEALGWPLCFAEDEIDDPSLKRAFDYCLTIPGRHNARECGARGRSALEAKRERLIEALDD